MQKLYTCSQVARELGIKPDSVRQYIHYGTCEATKIGRDWVISADEVERMRQTKARVRRYKLEAKRGGAQ